ncbi:MAG: type IX secretion system membrane protein PorP/SprF [Bacteroidota bacterium]
MLRQPFYYALSKANPPFRLLRCSIFILLAALSYPAFTQQEAQFTKYFFNSLVFNPAYAGSQEHLSAVVIYRDQWFNWESKYGGDGRPVSATFSAHSTVNKRVGLGLNVASDRIGAREATFINACYAYRISFGKGTLSLGFQAGLTNWRADWNKLLFQDPRELDFAFQGENPSLLLPDFGAGVFYKTERFYAGASIPHLAQFHLRQVDPEEQATIRKWAKTYRHFYLTAGGAVPLDGDDLVFKPSILIKSVGVFSEFFKQGDLVREIGAPGVFDLDLSLLLRKKLWVGAAFRSSFAAFANQGAAVSSHDSVDGWVAFLFDNGMRLGFAYDYPVSKIQPYAGGSFEVMLGFDFVKNVEKAATPRYF